MRKLISTLILAAAMAACGQPATTQSEAQADTGAAAALSEADRTAMLNALSAHPNAQGEVQNQCGDMVTPQFVPVDLGGDVGVAQLVIIPGGPSSYTCYGDGPGDMHVMRRAGSSFTDIYQIQGAYLIVMPTTHNGVHDIVEGGPGMSHPLAWWSGAAYTPHGEISDSASSAGQIYPQ